MAMNKRAKFYEDEERMEKFMGSQEKSSAQKFIEELVADIKRFCGGTPQSDDITAIYLIRD